MKVRALADGTFGGYFRVGPFDVDGHRYDGEIFEIPDGRFPIPVVNDLGLTVKNPATGEPLYVMETVTDPKTGKQIERRKTFSWFSPEWMAKVPDNSKITYKYPPWEPPVQYRAIEREIPESIGTGEAIPQPSAVI